MGNALPPQIARGAVLRGNEYAWPLEAFPEALTQAESLGFACLGGQFQFLLDNGTYEMYWLNADSNERHQGESWSDYCRRSCVEVLNTFQRIIRDSDFRKEASQWPALETECAKGLDIFSRLVFVAYFVSEAEAKKLAAR